jgi:hypothetical protein
MCAPVSPRVDWYAAVPAGQDCTHGLLVEARVSRQHEHLVQRGHGPVDNTTHTAATHLRTLGVTKVILLCVEHSARRCSMAGHQAAASLPDHFVASTADCHTHLLV